MKKSNDLIPVERLEKSILLIRGQKVMIDRDLAALYGVETRVLNQAVTRHLNRFPDDFMFELTREEIMRISQFVISSNLKFSKQVRALMEAPKPKNKKLIGFHVREKRAAYKVKKTNK